MKKAVLLIFISTFLFSFLIPETQTWRRYKIESGILKYKSSLMGIPAEGIIYFGNYGENERIIFKTKNIQQTILKIKDKQHVMVSDSMAITQDRFREFTWEKFDPYISEDNDSHLLTNYKFKEKFIALNLKCNKYSCIYKSEIKSEVIEWNNIPINILIGSVQEGYLETFEVLEIDTITKIPENYLTLQNYIDTGE